MEIRWLGQSTFELKTSTGTVICDPYPGLFESGSHLDPNTVVTMSRRGPPLADMPETVHAFDRPGEYEAGSISVRGVASPAGAPGQSRAVNTVFLIDAEGMTVCALGLPGTVPDATALQMMGPVDVLLVRTDGTTGLPMDQRAAAVRTIEPRLVVPSGYDASTGAPGPALASFLRQMGVKQAEAQPRLAVSKASLPEDMKVIVLSPRA